MAWVKGKYKQTAPTQFPATERDKQPIEISFLKESSGSRRPIAFPLVALSVTDS